MMKRDDSPQATLLVRVQPRASSTAIVGRRGETLLVRVAAAPVDGAANEACLALLGRLLRTPPSSKRAGHGPALRVALIKGAHSRDKVIRVFGLSQDQVQTRLEDLPEVKLSREK